MLQKSKQTGSIDSDKVQCLVGEQVSKRNFSELRFILIPRQGFLLSSLACIIGYMFLPRILIILSLIMKILRSILLTTFKYTVLLTIVIMLDITSQNLSCNCKCVAFDHLYLILRPLPLATTDLISVAMSLFMRFQIQVRSYGICFSLTYST